MTRRAPFLSAALLPLVLASVALAGGEPGEPKKAGAPDAQKPEAAKGPEIAWARSYAEAKEEAAERNVAIYLHSHGST